MPKRCSVPHCRGNYNNGPKVSVFGFPKNEELRNKWLKLINRENFTPTANSAVCSLHFTEDDIERTISFTDPDTGRVLTAQLDVNRLKKTAVPSIFFEKKDLEEETLAVWVCVPEISESAQPSENEIQPLPSQENRLRSCESDSTTSDTNINLEDNKNKTTKKRIKLRKQTNSLISKSKSQSLNCSKKQSASNCPAKHGKHKRDQCTSKVTNIQQD